MVTIHEAAFMGNMNRVKALLKQGVPVNFRNRAGRTPLHHAANAGRLSIIQELLRRGAHVNPRARNGQTPLGVAATFGQRRAVHALMKAGANPKYRTKIGLSPSNYAMSKATRNALSTSRAATKWLKTVRKRRAERMLLSPRLFGSTPLTKNAIRSIARFVTVKKNSR